MGFEDIFYNVLFTLLIAVVTYLGSGALLTLFKIPIQMLNFVQPFKKIDELIDDYTWYIHIPMFLISFYLIFTSMILGW